MVFGDISPGQPPNRGFEHTIELEPRVSTIITTLYRNLKAYQDEIERAIHELLAVGHIRTNFSPFYSLVVLVKKKDGSLWMFIDYMALNKKMTKKDYPIPRMDELMNKLRGEKFFSKIDLRLGYHQIWLRKFVLVFFDVILVYNWTWEDHLQHLEVVLHIPEEQKIYAKLSKCEFGLIEMLYLGHIIGEDIVIVHEEKIRTI
eukprot:PITA_24134